MMGLIPDHIGTATEKAHLPKLTLGLGIMSYCEMDDLSCLARVYDR